MSDNITSVTMHLNDPSHLRIGKLYENTPCTFGNPDAVLIRTELGGSGLILSLAYAYALSTQLNEYLARLAAENRLAAVSEVVG